MASTISCLTYKHHFTNITVPTHAHCRSTITSCRFEHG